MERDQFVTSPVVPGIWNVLFAETEQSGLNLQGRICRMMFTALGLCCTNLSVKGFSAI
ncbi:hypothetical protein [Acinetobacter pittii]|uniref:hypothetical protein n=1 Tax=Acinetobacter pittii TaxID=48296 RepID=UPI0021D23C83|nr:hypothetical protein [Acinetobacter pittii]MCU4456944.1 hypothetical protein [Acinetobacter pittii]